MKQKCDPSTPLSTGLMPSLIAVAIVACACSRNIGQTEGWVSWNEIETKTKSVSCTPAAFLNAALAPPPMAAAVARQFQLGLCYYHKCSLPELRSTRLSSLIWKKKKLSDRVQKIVFIFFSFFLRGWSETETKSVVLHPFFLNKKSGSFTPPFFQHWISSVLGFVI